MRKVLLISLVLLLFFSNAALADYSCSDANTSLFNTTVTVGSSSIPVSYPTNCFLSGGCNSATGQCFPSPYDVSLGSIGILFSILILGIIFYIMSLRVDDELYKIFFHFAALFFFLATLLIDVSFVNNLNITSSMGYVSDLLWIIIIALILAIFALFLLLLNDAIGALSGKPLFGKRKKQ